MFGAPPRKDVEIPPGVVMVLVDVDEDGEFKFLAVMEDGSVMATAVPVVEGNVDTLNRFYGGKLMEA